MECTRSSSSWRGEGPVETEILAAFAAWQSYRCSPRGFQSASAVVHSSFCDDEDGGLVRGAGGVAVILPPLSPPAVGSCAMPLIKGRVLRVDVVLGTTQMVMFNVHNRGLTKGDVQHVCEQIRCALRLAADNPL
eukprot:2642708-Pyramimonas_sp.AAC.1